MEIGFDLERTKSSGNVKNPDIRLKLCNPYWTFQESLVPENHNNLLNNHSIFIDSKSHGVIPNLPRMNVQDCS